MESRIRKTVRRKPVVGYTTGVFDLFHIGHLNILKKSKKRCDKLIVGVTTDELALFFKGKKAAVPYKERVAILKALKYVDAVVPQKTMDKYTAWKKYRFDVMFVTAKASSKWPKVEVEFISRFRKGKAPRIVRFPYTAGVSSTKRRNVLKK